MKHIPSSIQQSVLSQDCGRAPRSGRSQISTCIYSGTNSRNNPGIKWTSHVCIENKLHDQYLITDYKILKNKSTKVYIKLKN